MISESKANAGLLIEVSRVSKSYGSHRVLQDVSFSVSEGEAFAILGPNGAGKSTLFKVLTGETSANAGDVRYRGRSVVAMPAHLRALSGIGRTFQVARVFPEYTVIENVVVAIEARRRGSGEPTGGMFARRPLADIMTEASSRLHRIGLFDKRLAPSGSLSHGDKKRLELATTLALEPDVLMLDEPTAGMSPPERHETVQLLQEIRQSHGVTILLTEHDMGVVFGLADRIMVLNYGEVIGAGAAEDVRNDPHVQEIYLGKEVDAQVG